MKRFLLVRLLVVLFVAAALGLVGAACGGDFDSQSKVTTVRIFGVKADKPYANPGDTVTLQVLATDARPQKPLPLKIFWIPFTCLNPFNDLYYLCFGGRGDAGTGAGAASAASAASALAQIPKNVDLSAFLPQGDTFSFQMPQNAVQPRAGSVPYGLAIVFNIACAGQVRLVDRTGDNPQQVPIRCTDTNGKDLTPNDYVIGINRVYAYGDRTNTNPVVDAFTRDGVNIPPADGKSILETLARDGITMDHCVRGKDGDKRADCKAVKLNPHVTDASWEANPSEGASGQKEQIWATYYSDIGDLKDEARLLFDSTRGRVSESDIEYRAPWEPAEGTLWVVVHDNRAGAELLSVPLHIK